MESPDTFLLNYYEPKNIQGCIKCGQFIFYIHVFNILLRDLPMHGSCVMIKKKSLFSLYNHCTLNTRRLILLFNILLNTKAVNQFFKHHECKR